MVPPGGLITHQSFCFRFLGNVYGDDGGDNGDYHLARLGFWVVQATYRPLGFGQRANQ